MSIGYTDRRERRHTAEVFRDNWIYLVLLGVALVVAGAAAILVPAVSEIPADELAEFVREFRAHAP